MSSAVPSWLPSSTTITSWSRGSARARRRARHDDDEVGASLYAGMITVMPTARPAASGRRRAGRARRRAVWSRPGSCCSGRERPLGVPARGRRISGRVLHSRPLHDRATTEPRVAFLGYAHDARGGIAQFGRAARAARWPSGPTSASSATASSTRASRGPAGSSPTPALRAIAPRRRRRSPCRGTRAPGARPPPTCGVRRRTCSSSSGGARCSARASAPILRRARRARHAHADHVPQRPAARAASRSRAQITRATLAQADALAAFTEHVADGSAAMRPRSRAARQPAPACADRRPPTARGPWDDRLGAPPGTRSCSSGTCAPTRAWRTSSPRSRRCASSVDAALVVAGTFMEPVERYGSRRARSASRTTSRSCPTTSPTSTCPACSRAATSSRSRIGHATGSAVLGEARGRGQAGRRDRVGPLPAMVGDRGVLVPPRDPAALADGLVRALQRPAAAPAAGRRARGRAGATIVLEHAQRRGMTARRHHIIPAARRAGDRGRAARRPRAALARRPARPPRHARRCAA